MPEASSEEVARGVVRGAPWDGVLDGVHRQMVGARRPARASAASAEKTVARALARAHSHLVVALDPRSNAAADTVSELVTSTAALLRGALALCEAHVGYAPDLGRELDNALARRLGAHEHAVLAGEVTYGLRSEEAGEAAARMRELIAGLPKQTRLSHGDLLSLRLAAVELASLLVRAAGNAAAGGRADEAPETRSQLLDGALRAITLELASRARAVEKPVDPRGDIAAHHLGAALRVQARKQTLEAVAAAGVDGAAEPALRAARQAWLVLATHEYVAVAALDNELEVPTYRERFENLADAIVEGAANVICGARLAGRPSALRHRHAWRHHATALTYALEAYVAGLRGDAASFAQAQLITLTRLIRAVVAIALLDLQRARILPNNGHRQAPIGPRPHDEEERSDA